MRCAPGQEPEIAQSRLLPLREIICDALNTLTPREAWIFEALVYRRLSLKQCADELQISKTHTVRLRDGINAKLREQLLTSPEIERYLKR